MTAHCKAKTLDLQSPSSVGLLFSSENEESGLRKWISNSSAGWSLSELGSALLLLPEQLPIICLKCLAPVEELILFWVS